MTSALFPLLPSWHEERIVLACAQDAIRLCRDDSHQALPWWRGYGLVEGLARRDRFGLREFVLRLRRARLPTACFDDRALLRLVCDGLKGGDLVAVRVCDGTSSGQVDPTAQQRRLVRRIEAATRGRLDLAGRRYKLATDTDLGRVPGRENYVVVRHDEAKQILGALAGQGGTSPDTQQLYFEAQRLLAKDWRPPFSPEGLVLLRRHVTQAATKAPTGSPITPSQMKNLLKEWIEIEVVDDKGRPYTGRYRLALPGGGKAEGDFPRGGWSNYAIDPGECKLTLLSPEGGAPVGDEDEDEDEAAESGWLALRLVDPDGNPMVNRRYRIEFADGTSREDVWTEEELRLDGIPEGKYTLTLLPEEESQADPGT